MPEKLRASKEDGAVVVWVFGDDDDESVKMERRAEVMEVIDLRK